MIYRSENFCLDTAAYTLLCDGAPQPIEPQVFDLLIYLIENRDRVVTRAELLDNLWPGRVVSDSALNGRLKIARKAVGDDGKKQRIIKTFQRRGYQFIADVGVVESGTPKLQIPESSPADGKPSIAVLKFTNLSKQDGQEYFAEGISMNVRSCLSRIHALKIVSALEIDSSGESKLEIVRNLGADYLLSGSVQREGDRARVFVDLTDAQTGAITWSERFDRRGKKVMEIQDDIATSVVATLWGFKGRIVQAAIDNLAFKQTQNFTAFDCVLRAAYLKEKYSAAEASEAHEWLDRAIELNPNFAEAYAFKAMISLMQNYMGWTSEPDKIANAVADARRSVELDPYCEDGYLALGWAYVDNGDRERGLAAFERGLEINPNNAAMMVFKGGELAADGLVDEGIELIQQAIRLNLRAPDWYYWHLGLALFQAARLPEAIVAFERMGRQNKDTLIHLAASYANTNKLDRSAEMHAALMQEDPLFSPDQINETHNHYPDVIQTLLLQGLEIASGSKPAAQKLKIVKI